MASIFAKDLDSGNNGIVLYLLSSGNIIYEVKIVWLRLVIVTHLTPPMCNLKNAMDSCDYCPFFFYILVRYWDSMDWWVAEPAGGIL